jgi:peroxiredoxin
MAWILSVLLCVSSLVAWVLLFQLLRQHGALLVRFDRLDERLAASGLEGFQVDAGPQGVAVGSPLPPFRLPDLNGKPAALEDYRGRRVVLVQWSTTCSFCDAIAPDLARAAPELRKRNTELVLVTSGDREANGKLAAEYGFDFPVLLQDEPIEAFAEVGTPAAYLLDEEGRVAKGLVLGADKVPQLLDDALNGARRLASERPLSESRIERDGLKPGTPAPAFELPAVDGGTVSLGGYRGRRVLIVFSDPHCEPCDELMPQLVALYGRAREAGVELVMVSRGYPEENRRKCAEHGIDFPVGIQRGWRVSKEYGIFATPVAFVVDADGVIARAVARGPEAIVALAEAEIGAREEAHLEV